MCLKAHISCLEADIEICKDSFGILKSSAFLWSQKYFGFIHAMPRKLHMKRVSHTNSTVYKYTGYPTKIRDDSNCHISFKNGTRNKSRVSFEILRKSSCWWALKFFNFNFWGLRKWGLKLVTLHLKAWPNQTFSVTVFFWHNWNWNTLVFHMNISLLCLKHFLSSMIFFCGRGIDTQV